MDMRKMEWVREPPKTMWLNGYNLRNRYILSMHVYHLTLVYLTLCMFISFRHASKYSTPSNISLSYGSSPERCSGFSNESQSASNSNASRESTTPDDIHTKEDFDFYSMNNPMDELEETVNSLEKTVNSLALENQVLKDKLTEKENISMNMSSIGKLIFLVCLSII